MGAEEKTVKFFVAMKGFWKILRNKKRRDQVMGMLTDPLFQNRILSNYSTLGDQTDLLYSEPNRLISEFPFLTSKRIALVGGCEFEYCAEILKENGVDSYHTFTDAGATNPFLELSSENSKVWDYKPEILLFSVSDIIRSQIKKIQENESSFETLEDSLKEIEQFSKKIAEICENKLDARVFVVSYDLVYRPVNGILDYKKTTGNYSIETYSRKIEDVLNNLAQQISNLYFINISSLFSNPGKLQTLQIFEDNAYWTHYNRLGASYIVQNLLKQLIAIEGKGKRIKCVVVDLDNTLWEGILRDDGVNNLRLRHDRLYILTLLKKRGILIAICSKNDPEDEQIISDLLNIQEVKVLYDVPNPFAADHYPYKDLFVVKKINWQDKTLNIQEIAEELNIGLDSLAFFDDNPFEREQVQKMLPMISIYPEWAIKDTLNLPEFEPLNLTKESENRTDMIKSAKKREVDQEKYQDDKEAFLKSCNMKVWIREAENKDMNRVFEMVLRTNQLNMTTIRYTPEELTKIHASDDYHLYIVDLVDKYGEYGTIGLAIIHEIESAWEIETFLFSCRAMGKTAERLFLLYLLNNAKTRKIERVIGRYKKTAKNKLMEKFFSESKFIQILENSQNSKDGEEVTKWCFDLSSNPIDEYPPWFNFIKN
jgi:FkbH-like protein